MLQKGVAGVVEGTEGKVGRANVFVVSVPNRDYFFQAYSRDDMEQWITSVTAALSVSPPPVRCDAAAPWLIVVSPAAGNALRAEAARLSQINPRTTGTPASSVNPLTPLRA